MDSKNRSFWWAAVIAMASGPLISLLLGSSDQGMAGARASDTLRLQGQADTDRIWQEVASRKLWEVGGEGTEFYGPLDLHVAEDDHVFVVDFGDLSVKELSAEGELLRIYGGRQGQGPGELLSITDVVLPSPDEVWIADDSSGNILIYDREGRLQGMTKLKVPPYRVVFREEGTFYVMMPPGSVDMFGLVRRDVSQGSILRTFGKLVERQKDHLIGLDGWIHEDGSGGFVYTGLYAGILARFNRELRPVFLRRTVDPSPIPKVLTTERRSWVDDHARISAQKMSISDQRIFLLSRIDKAGRPRGAMDVYDLENGGYIHSFRLPAPCARAVVRRDSLWSATDTTLTKWSLRIHRSEGAGAIGR